jgi:hypothetical protein
MKRKGSKSRIKVFFSQDVLHYMFYRCKAKTFELTNVIREGCDFTCYNNRVSYTGKDWHSQTRQKYCRFDQYIINDPKELLALHFRLIN